MPKDKIQKWLFYGWIVIIACAAVNMGGYGLRYAFSTFYPFVLADTGWKAAETALAFSIHMYWYGVLTIFMGLLCDKLGPRWTIAIFAGIFWPLGFYLSSVAPSPFWFIIAYGVIAAIGSAACYVPVMGTAPKWFIAKRGVATGIVSIGVSFGWILASVTGALILAVGWRSALVYLAIIALVILWVAPQFIVRMPEDKGMKALGAVPTAPPTSRTDGGRPRRLILRAFCDFLALAGIFYKPARELFYESLERPPETRRDGGQKKMGFIARMKASERSTIDLTYRQMLKSWGFWMIFIAYAISLIGLYAALNNFPALFTRERVPADPAAAKAFTAMIAVSWGLITAFSSMIGRFAGGWVSDIIGRKLGISIFFVLQALAIAYACLTPAGSEFAWYTAAAFYTFTYGLWVPLIPAISADVCGRSVAAAAFGLITFGAGVGTGTGGLLPPLLSETTKTFTTGFWVGAVAFLVAIIPIMLVRAPGRTGAQAPSQ